MHAQRCICRSPQTAPLVNCSWPSMISLFVGLVFILAACAGGTAPSFRVDPWTGRSYTDDATGRFTDCAALVSYSNGIRMALALNRDYGWTLSFYNPLWSLNPYPYLAVPIQLQIPDGGWREEIFGTVINPTTVIISIPGNSRQLDALRIAYRINTTVGGHRFAFNLTDTSELMTRLVDCVHTSLALEYEDPPRR